MGPRNQAVRAARSACGAQLGREPSGGESEVSPVARFTLSFESELKASPDEAWSWVTSMAGILAELRPIARMTAPRGITTILDVDVKLGMPLTRSWFLLFGFLPLDRSDLTLIELDDRHGFVEQSPMLSMRLWRHERTIDPVAGGCKISDRLTFEPRFSARLVKWFIAALFRHRHRVLRRELGAMAS
jgi:ligand-binding SRPBCC domain-containing protein